MSTQQENQSKIRTFLGHMANVLNVEYLFFLTESLFNFLQNSLLQYLFTPLTLALSGINMLLSAYELYTAKNRNLPKIVALPLDTVLFVLLSIFAVLSVLGGILGSAALLLAATLLIPIIASIAVFYHAGLSLYYLFKSFLFDDKEQKKEYRHKGLIHLAKAIGLTLLAIAVTLLFVVGVAPKVMAALCIGLTCVAILGGIGIKLKELLGRKKETQILATSAATPQTTENNKPLQKKANVAESAPAQSRTPSSFLFKTIKKYDFFKGINREKIMKQENYSEKEQQEFLFYEISYKIGVLNKKLNAQNQEKSELPALKEVALKDNPTTKEEVKTELAKPSAAQEESILQSMSNKNKTQPAKKIDVDKINEKIKALEALRGHLAAGADSLIVYKGKQYATRESFIDAIPAKVFTNVWKATTDIEDIFAATCNFLDAQEQKKVKLPAAPEKTGIEFNPFFSPSLQ